MNQTLMKAIIEFAVFLGLSEDEAINPDAAIAQLEQLAANMKELKTDECRIFVEYIKTQSLIEEYSPRREFIWSLPENLGLESDNNNAI